MEHVEEDDVLMAQLQRGETAALAGIYKRHRGVVNAVIRSQFCQLSESDAEDLNHETFLELVKIAKRYRPGSGLKGWLCGIALKKARRKTSGNWLREKLLKRFGGESEAETHHVSERVEAAQLVQRRLSQLPQPMREVIVLCLVEGMETADVATALGISVNTVWTRLHRAREMLRKLEEDEA